MHIAYYVTGHGFGHATRAIGLINRLLDSNHSVDVVSSLSPQFFVDGVNDAYRSRLRCLQRTLDVGAIQIDALHVDPNATLSTYYETIHVRQDIIESQEAAYIEREGIDIVLVDATPLACSASRIAHRPCVLVTNLTWDEIYRGILGDIKDTLSDELVLKYSEMIDQCSSKYAAATHYLQLPGRMAVPQGYVGPVTEMPMVCRHANKSKDELFDQYGIPKDKNVVILGFGGQKGSDLWRIDDNMLPPDWIGLLLGATKSMIASGAENMNRLISIPHDAYIPDFISAADCVIGKLGYGTVSECLYHNTPLIYVPRVFWPEEPYLVSVVNEYNAGIEMSEEDFHHGNWSPYLEVAKARKKVCWNLEALRPDGAYDVVYEHIGKIYKSYGRNGSELSQ